MSAIWAMAAKEWRQFFSSPRAWIFSTMLLLLTGYFFVVPLLYFSQYCLQASGYATDPRYAGMLEHLNVNEAVLRPFFGQTAVILLFFIPAATMRLWAEERRQGTAELLFSSPVSDLQLALGKFLGGALAVLTPLAATALYLLAVWKFAENPDWGSVAAGYAGLVLLVLSFVAIGMAVSASTANQIVAMVLTFALLLLFYIVAWVSEIVPFRTGQILKYLSLMEHLENFSKGVVEAKDLVYFASVTVFGILVTHHVLGARRWKG